MNVIGKILVILNLVFALVVGGFLVIDFATRQNWKQAYEKQTDYMRSADANYKASMTTISVLNVDNKRLKADLETEKKNRIDDQTQAKVMLEGVKVDLQVAKDQTQETNLNLQKTLSENERLKSEIKDRDLAIAARDKAILDERDLSKTFRTQAVAHKATADAMAERNVSLLEKVQTLERQIALGSVRGGDKSLTVDPNAPNPPSTYVKGMIEKVIPGDNLVQISIGSDHGVKKDHTLEVFRLRPQAEYLGMIRIMNSEPHKSYGKLIRNGAVPKKLQIGDTVASSTSGP